MPKTNDSELSGFNAEPCFGLGVCASIENGFDENLVSGDIPL
jgi:hypothetical protein